MPIEISASRPDQLAQIAHFLGETLGYDAGAPFLDLGFLKWKLFSPRQDWSGPRSFVATDGGEIIAHVCLWPGVLAVSGAQFDFTHPLDWAANPSHPGVGFALFRKVTRKSGLNVVIGGSAHGIGLLPKLGFVHGQNMEVYARVVRAWKQHFSRRNPRNPRAIARAFRNAAWSFASSPDHPAGWSTHAADDDLSGLPQLSPRQGLTDCGRSLRSLDSLRYLFKCPHANCRLTYITRADKVIGYFMLSNIRGQCRIADIYVDSDARDLWRDAYKLVPAGQPRDAQAEAETDTGRRKRQGPGRSRAAMPGRCAKFVGRGRSSATTRICQK